MNKSDAQQPENLTVFMDNISSFSSARSDASSDWKNAFPFNFFSIVLQQNEAYVP